MMEDFITTKSNTERQNTKYGPTSLSNNFAALQNFEQTLEKTHRQGEAKTVFHKDYRVTGQDGKSLPLTQFRQFQQLVGRYLSYLLPKEDDRTPKTRVEEKE